ncbi:MAG: vanadium-dependent haloperoxidase [Acidimicrobiia bacterium]|nr:vanadium-dependent haloperoxidase [Acidimicrobiia bacterium]
MRASFLRIAAIGVALLLIAAGVVVTRPGSEGQCRPIDGSAATIWIEAALDAIRRDFPAPTVHSRNLYHLSAALWDTWAAFDATASGVFVDEPQVADNVVSARIEAISFAAHRMLTERYRDSTGAEQSLAEFDLTLASLCFDPAGGAEPDSPAAFGVRVADAILSEARNDGSLETSGYADPSYASVNPPLVVDEPGTEMVDPNRWQPLSLSEQVTQNGQRIEASLQEFIGPNWGFVTPFAIDPDPDRGLPFDPGPPPLLETDDDDFVAGASEVVEFSSRLDPSSDATIDISPASLGDVALGTYDAEGRPVNPVTGAPYAPNVVLEADYGRVIAEYWADGPDSETPPGHWNTLAIDVANVLEADEALSIDGLAVSRLEWDVKVGLALNGALHDTAIAVWGTKAHYDYARPISMIRYLGQRGKLDETPGVIETITNESSSPVQRHGHLAAYVGEQAVRTWLGEPFSPTSTTAGVGWIRAAHWVPYQRASFVSPAFAGYVSGHSGFSRAAAEVLTELTGSPFFPGGLATHTVEPGDLLHEAGPTEPVVLQWATYRDAADQAGISRLYGGIHVRADDLRGRTMGAEIGKLATEHARSYFRS